MTLLNVHGRSSMSYLLPDNFKPLTHHEMHCCTMVALSYGPFLWALPSMLVSHDVGSAGQCWMAVLLAHCWTI